MSETVLVIGAHPDDEVLGCGGAIARHVAHGDQVHVAIMGEGAMSRHASSDATTTAELARLGECAQRCGEILGVASIYFHGFPDNRMDSFDQLTINKAVANVGERLKPTIVYTHHAFDLNVDHRRIHEAVMTAFRPLPGSIVRKILCFETPSSTEWQTPVPHLSFTPQFHVDITDLLELKLKALEAYGTEMREFPHPRSLKGVEYLARLRGAAIGCHAAEAFMVSRIIA